jgi:hypothetical protein
MKPVKIPKKKPALPSNNNTRRKPKVWLTVFTVVTEEGPVAHNQDPLKPRVIDRAWLESITINSASFRKGVLVTDGRLSFNLGTRYTGEFSGTSAIPEEEE